MTSEASVMEQAAAVIGQHRLIEMLGRLVVMAGRGDLNGVGIVAELTDGSVWPHAVILPGGGQNLLCCGVSELGDVIRDQLDEEN